MFACAAGDGRVRSDCGRIRVVRWRVESVDACRSGAPDDHNDDILNDNHNQHDHHNDATTRSDTRPARDV